jgi:hypothetical protein
MQANYVCYHVHAMGDCHRGLESPLLLRMVVTSGLDCLLATNLADGLVS